jgi:small subunit ribosomal protein S7
MVLKNQVNRSLITLFETRLFRDGKRNSAARVFYDVISSLKHKNRNSIIFGLKNTTHRAYPHVLMRSKKVGGAVYQIPLSLNSNKRLSLGIRWLTDSCGLFLHSRYTALSRELLIAPRRLGVAAKKRKTLHTLAFNNRAYIKYL